MEKEIHTAYLTSAYLPPIEYFSKIKKYDKVVIERYDHYVKQTYRNRCSIASPNGKLDLSIPIVKPKSGENAAKDIKISTHGNWQHIHWNAIESAYGNTPFFEYYKDDFKPFYDRQYDGLFDYNLELIKLCCQIIDLDTPIEFTEQYKTEFHIGEYDFREIISPKVSYAEQDKEFNVLPYYQVFQEKLGFIPNLSIIDLIFNMGPESILYI